MRLVSKMSGSLCCCKRKSLYKGLKMFSHMYSSGGLGNTLRSQGLEWLLLWEQWAEHTFQGGGVFCVQLTVMPSRGPSLAPGALNLIGPLSTLKRSHARFCPIMHCSLGKFWFSPRLYLPAKRLWRLLVPGDSCSRQDDRGCLQRPSGEEGPR